MSGIDLARAAPFTLGVLEVRPATREVSAGGASEVLQPRIMQVLVALGARAGAVVSRDQLIAMCWDGQVVGDDAINRCIAKLRQLGEAHGAFEIVTIARVGYRLDERVANVAAPKADATPVLAVLPFENLSSDPEMQFFSDGVSEEILNAVARLGGLRLIGSTSSFSFRGARKSEAARALSATHVLDGSVQRASARVRINVQLTEAARGEIVWNERYDREIADVFAVQDEIAAMVAETLSSRLAGASPPKPKVDPEAVDLYLRAVTVRKAYDSAEQERAISYLQAALAIAPNFARARAALALTLCQRILDATVVSAPPEAFDDAVAAVEREAERALALDPSEPQALVAALSIQTAINAWGAHEAAINAAVFAAPSDPLLLTLKARFVTSVGRLREGFDINEWVVANDPLSARAMAFQAVRRTSISTDYAEARDRVDRAYAMAPKDPLVWRLRTVVLAYQRDWAESMKMYDIGLEVGQTPERLAFMRAGAEYEMAGGARDGNPFISTAKVLIGRSPFLLTSLLFSLISTHDFYEEAFDFIDEAMRMHPPRRLWSQWNTESLSVTPTLAFFVVRAAGFRAHPRFLPLCARLGLCSYWAETGKWPDFIVDAENRAELERQVRELVAQ